MDDTGNKKEMLKSLKRLIIQSVHAYHNTLSMTRIRSMSLRHMLSYCHPRDRAEYENKLSQIKRMKDEKTD